MRGIAFEEARRALASFDDIERFARDLRVEKGRAGPYFSATTRSIPLFAAIARLRATS